jgi:hypothetical protein
MSKFIEELEIRRLLSISPAIPADAKAINAEATAIKATANAFLTSIKAENKALVSSVQALHVSSNGSRLTSLSHDEKAGLTAIKKAGVTLQKAESKAVAKVVADLRKLSAKPGNVDLQAVLAVDEATLTNGTTTNTTALESAYEAHVELIEADVNDIAVANSSNGTVQAAALAENDTLSGDVTAAISANTILAADVTQLLTDA